MLLLPCPHCGLRDEGEFDYGGPWRSLPALDGAADAAVWQAALHAGAGTPESGALREIWYHASGCAVWIVLSRDLYTHDVVPAPPAPGTVGAP